MGGQMLHSESAQAMGLIATLSQSMPMRALSSGKLEVGEVA